MKYPVKGRNKLPFDINKLNVLKRKQFNHEIYQLYN